MSALVRVRPDKTRPYPRPDGHGHHPKGCPDVRLRERPEKRDEDQSIYWANESCSVVRVTLNAGPLAGVRAGGPLSRDVWTCKKYLTSESYQ